MGGGGLGGGLGAAGFDDDDGLGEGHFAGGGQEGAGVANAFHVDDDALGVRIVAEVGDQIAPADIQHGAQGDEGAEADVFLQAPIENGGAEAPLWLMKPTLPGRAMSAAKVAFNLAAGTMTPRQLGPTMRMPALRASSRTWRSSSTPGAPISLNPAEMMMTPLTPLTPQSLTMAGTVAGGVMMTANPAWRGREDAGIGLDAQDGVTLGVDRVNDAGEAAFDQVFQDGAADAADGFGGSNDGDRLWRENGRQRAARRMVQNIVRGLDGIRGGYGITHNVCLCKFNQFSCRKENDSVTR